MAFLQRRRLLLVPLFIISVYTVSQYQTVKQTVQSVVNEKVSARLRDDNAEVAGTATRQHYNVSSSQPQEQSLARVYTSAFVNDNPYSWCTTRRDDSDGGLYYIKIPKCASSTGAGVTLQLTHHVAKRLHLPRPCHSIHRHYETQKRAPLNQRDRAKTLLWTTVRHPAKRVTSSYFFFQVSRGNSTPSDSKLIGYAQQQQNIMTTTLTIGSLRNYTWQQVFQHELDFCAVAERMEESLVVFRLLFGFERNDMIVLSSKVSGGFDDGLTRRGCVQLLKTPTVSPRVHAFFENKFSHENDDYLLYEAANASLDKTIDMLGRERVQEEVEWHRQAQQLADRECMTEAKFPCRAPGIGGRQFALARQSCYDNDWGCGHECVERVLSQQHTA